jgi:hypothetical protein
MENVSMVAMAQNTIATDEHDRRTFQKILE